MEATAVARWEVNRDMACRPEARVITIKMELEAMASREAAMVVRVASVGATRATHTSRAQVAMVDSHR